MNEKKSLPKHFAEWWDKRQSQSQIERKPNHWLPGVGNILFTLLVAALLILTQRVWATSSQSANIPGSSATTINYQGRLADDAGNPQTGTLGMSFAIWDAADGGGIIWGPESHSAIPVTDGLFNVGLGSQTSGGIPTTVWNGDRYLEITVSGETLTPRELIRSVPIAGMALTVPDGAIDTGKIMDGAVTKDKAPTLLLAPGSNQRMEKSSVAIELQPGWQSNVAHTTFDTPFTGTPIVTVANAGDGHGDNPVNIVLSVTATGVDWNAWSGHSSGTRSILVHWIAVGE